MLASIQCSRVFLFCFKFFHIMYSRLSGCSNARGSDSRLSLGGPTKVMARKSFLFTVRSLKDAFRMVFNLKLLMVVMLCHYFLT